MGELNADGKESVMAWVPAERSGDRKLAGGEEVSVSPCTTAEPQGVNRNLGPLRPKRLREKKGTTESGKRRQSPKVSSGAGRYPAQCKEGS